MTQRAGSTTSTTTGKKQDGVTGSGATSTDTKSSARGAPAASPGPGAGLAPAAPGAGKAPQARATTPGAGTETPTTTGKPLGLQPNAVEDRDDMGYSAAAPPTGPLKTAPHSSHMPTHQNAVDDQGSAQVK